MVSTSSAARASTIALALVLLVVAGCSRSSRRRGGDSASSSPGSAPAAESAPGGPVGAVSSCGLPQAPDTSTFRVAKDVTYAKVGGEQLVLDVAWPNQGGPHPLVVLVHGGGWADGAKYWYVSEIETLASLGYTAATIDYRLASEQRNIFPAAVQDVRCAVRWLVASKERYSIDVSRVALVGGSAGGQLAALAASAGDVSSFDQACATTTPVPRIAAVVAVSAPFDLRSTAFGGHEQGQWDVASLLGAPARERVPLAEQASPITHVDRSDPPVLMVHGTTDATVPVSESRAYKAALDRAGVDNLLVEVPTKEHAFSPLAPEDAYRESTCTVLAFLKRHLRPGR